MTHLENTNDPYIHLYEEHQNMCTDTFIHNRARTSVYSTSEELNGKQLQLLWNTTQDGRHTYVYGVLTQCKLKCYSDGVRAQLQQAKPDNRQAYIQFD